MNRFSQVKIYLDEAIEGRSIGAHGAFWRGLSRDEFVEYKVFGVVEVVSVGDGANSNLIKRLRGDGVRRMPPAPFSAMPDDRIAFIQRWIDDGAPADVSDAVTVDSDAGDTIDPELHNAYWREFDNWATRGGTVRERVAVSFQLATVWAGFVRGDVSEADYVARLREPEVASALEYLSQRQMNIVEGHYGNPVPLKTLLESYELFGRGVDNGGLPHDRLRPNDSRHQMNGPQMWFNWCAMADACLRQAAPLHPEFWRGHIRAILLGLLNDGVHRGRFPVNGFSSSDPDVSRRMREHVQGVNDSQLQQEMAARFTATDFQLPFAVPVAGGAPGPGSNAEAFAAADTQAVVTPSFENHIKQMFREVDVESMLFMFNLHDYDQVSQNSGEILKCLKGEDGRRQMPPISTGGPWPEEWIRLFERWIGAGHPR